MENKWQYNTVSIIIPVYNEKNTILNIIEKVKKASVCGLKKEIVVVDDGSRDGTVKMLKKEYNIKVFFHDQNKGKGYALQTGFKNATGDILLVQDADLEYNPNEYEKLLKPIVDGESEGVYGCRFFYKEVFDKNMYYSHYLGNVLLSWITSFLYRQKIRDMETCYKLMKKEVLNDIKLNSNHFDIEPEITAKILKKGINIHEIPVSFNPRGFHEGKKINWRDGIVALWALIKYRFVN